MKRAARTRAARRQTSLPARGAWIEMAPLCADCGDPGVFRGTVRVHTKKTGASPHRQQLLHGGPPLAAVAIPALSEMVSTPGHASPTGMARVGPPYGPLRNRLVSGGPPLAAVAIPALSEMVSTPGYASPTGMARVRPPYGLLHNRLVSGGPPLAAVAIPALSEMVSTPGSANPTRDGSDVPGCSAEPQEPTRKG